MPPEQEKIASGTTGMSYRLVIPWCACAARDTVIVLSVSLLVRVHHTLALSAVISLSILDS